MTRIGLTGFGREELVALGVALGVGELRPGVVRSLLAHTGGNPLYCRALLEELTPEDLQRAGDRGIRAPRALGAVILGRLSGLSGQARDLVTAASVLPGLGQTTHFFPSKSSGLAASGPTRSVPATG